MSHVESLSNASLMLLVLSYQFPFALNELEIWPSLPVSTFPIAKLLNNQLVTVIVSL